MLRQFLVVALGIVAGLGLLAGLWLLARPLALVAVGIVIGEALSPIVDWGSRGLPRTATVVLLYVCLGAVLVTIAWFAVAPLTSQAQELIDSLPTLVEQAEAWVQRQSQRVGGVPILDTLGGQIQALAMRLFQLPMTVVTSLFELLLIGFLSLYWLLASPRLGQFVFSLIPAGRRDGAAALVAELSRTVGGYVRGVGINVILITVITYVGLRVIGLPFALVFGVIAGLLEVVPIVGSFVGGAIIVGFALSQSVQTALITLAFILTVQQLEGNILVPMVMRSQTDIDPFLILVALVLGGAAGGLLGVLIAIPLAGTLKVLTVRLVAPALRRRLGA